MNKVFLLPMVLGVVLMISFQNCSQSGFESASELTTGTTTQDKADQQFDVGSRIRNVNELGLGGAIACPMVMCAAPPDNCHYEQDATTDVFSGKDRRCNTSCGRLVCGSPGKRICPMIRCAAPPEGCKYAEKTSKEDPNACPECGVIVCKELPPRLPPIEEVPPIDEIPPIDEPVSCPLYKCIAPPEGCHVAAITKKDENGCNIGCGAVVCPKDDTTEINPTNVLPFKRLKDPIICPMYMCAAPPVSVNGQRCEYSGSPAVDKDGCAIGCGILACAEDK